MGLSPAVATASGWARIARGHYANCSSTDRVDDEKKAAVLGATHQGEPAFPAHRSGMYSEPSWVAQCLFCFIGYDAVPREMIDVGGVPLKHMHIL